MDLSGNTYVNLFFITCIVFSDEVNFYTIL